IRFLLNSARTQRLRIDVRVADLVTCELGEDLYQLIVVQTTLNHLKEPISIPACCRNIAAALKRGGILYCVGFTTNDPGFTGQDRKSECASFVTHYFSPEEMLRNFSTLECLRYEEYVKLDESHGPPHLHGK